MRILHLCQPTDGGAAVVAATLARAGVEAGDDVSVACPSGGFLADRIQTAGATWIDLAMTRTPGVADLSQVWRLRRLLRDYDLVHMHSSKAGALGRLAAATLRARRPRSIFTPHGWSWYVGGRAAAAYRWFERLAARSTDVITVVSETELTDGRNELGSVPRIQLIENGVDTSAFRPEGERAARRPEPLVVQVGRLSVQKGQDRSLRALAQLPDRTTRLRLVGDGPGRSSLEALAAELGVADRVEFAGMTDPAPHLRAADVVVLPSRWEGMPLALLEAMACGAAIVASDCGGSEALGDCGRLVAHLDDDRSVNEMAAAVTELLADPAACRRLGSAARARAAERHDIDQTLRGYRQVWNGCDQSNAA